MDYKIATVKCVLNTKQKLNDGGYPLSLRVTYERKPFYFHLKPWASKLPASMSKEAYDDLFVKKRSSKEERELKQTLIGLEARANSILEELGVFSKTRFQEFFYGKATSNRVGELDKIFQDKIEQYKANDQIGTADSYQCTFRSLIAFSKTLKNSNPSLFDITPQWLDRYERWMMEKSRSNNTIGIYLRQLRAVFNEAKFEGLIKEKDYPFGRRKYVIPATTNPKKALKKSQIVQLQQFEARSESEAWARDMWMFSYLCAGINLEDMIRLKWSNIQHDYLNFTRKKTAKTTKSESTQIRIKIHPLAMEIIDRWGSSLMSPIDFVFDIAQHGDTPARLMTVKKNTIKQINKYLKRISHELDFSFEVTFGHARHSYATSLKRSGAPYAYIQDTMGHKSITTTEKYMDSLDDEELENRMTDSLL